MKIFRKKRTVIKFLVIISVLIQGIMMSGCKSQNDTVLIYMAPNGNDTWSGTISEPNADKSDGPLATLEAARLKVREQISRGLTKPVEIQIRGGEYILEEPVVFDPKDAGSESFPITYKAYPGEQPTFSGGRQLTDWKKLENEPENISLQAKDQLWYSNIPGSLIGKWQITSLYEGDKLLRRARSGVFKASPEQVLDPFNAQPKDIRGVEWDADPLIFSREFHYMGSDLKNWKNPSDIEILLSPKHGWLINLLPLERIDIEKRTAIFSIDPTYGIKPGNTYYVENALEYLDEPGEWVFDSEIGRIYMWPGTTLDHSGIIAPFLQEFIRVEGIKDSLAVSYIHFEGLSFQHGLRDTWKEGNKGLQHDWEMYDKGNAILRFRHAEHCSVVNCTFKNSSGTGIRLDLFAQHITLADNLFSYLGGTGILLSGYGPGLKDENKFNTITNNYLHHVGEIYKHSPAIFIAQSGHNLISHNTIHDLAYNGMVISGCRPHELVYARPLQNRREWASSIRIDEIQSYIKDITPEMVKQWLSFDVTMIEPLLHSRENRIEYNDISRVMLELHDGNGIYFSGMGKNNIADHNYMHDITNSNGVIRLDDVSAYTIMTNNVGFNSDRMFQIKGPAKISNNFAINTSRLIRKRFYKMEMDHNIVYNNDPKGIDHSNTLGKPEEIKLVYGFIENWSNSLVFDVKLPEEMQVGQDLMPGSNSEKAGLLVADPMFDEAAFDQRNFRFKPGSPAIELGIEPIDLSNVGSTLAKQ